MEERQIVEAANLISARFTNMHDLEQAKARFVQLIFFAHNQESAARINYCDGLLQTAARVLVVWQFIAQTNQERIGNRSAFWSGSRQRPHRP